MDEMRRVEGSNYGTPVQMYLDVVISFLQKLLYRCHKEGQVISKTQNMKTIFKALEDVKLDNSLIDVITYLGQKNFELSPKGLLSYITLVHEAVNLGFASLARKFFKNVNHISQSTLQIVCSLMKENQLQQIQEYPSVSGGGSACVYRLILQMQRLLATPLSLPPTP